MLGRTMYGGFAAMVLAVSGCSDDPVTFLEAETPINSVAANWNLVTPAPNATITRGVSFAYSVPVFYEYRPEDFGANPEVELAFWGADLDLDLIPGCIFRQVGSIVPSSSSGEHVFSGNFTLPNTAACAQASYMTLALIIFSDDENRRQHEIYYDLN